MPEAHKAVKGKLYNYNSQQWIDIDTDVDYCECYHIDADGVKSWIYESTEEGDEIPQSYQVRADGQYKPYYHCSETLIMSLTEA